MNIYEKLLSIQAQLKCNKSQYNSFGKYKYRNCEDILEALKPILAKSKATVIISDEVINIADRFYVKATAKMVDTESGEHIETTAYAREEENKKGMDGSQVTGASSSYARKYALNGLFAIDDTKDADTLNRHGQEPAPKKVLSAQTRENINKMIMEYSQLSNKQVSEITVELSKMAGKPLKEITEDESKEVLKYLNICTTKLSGQRSA